MKKQQRIIIYSILILFFVFFTACKIEDTLGELDNRPPTNWTAVSNSPFTDSAVRDIIYNDNMFIAVGGSNIALSKDGKNWTSVAENIFGTFESDGLNSSIYFIAFGAGIYVICAYSGKMAWSEDLKNWTIVTDSTFGIDNSDEYKANLIYGIAYGNGKFVAVGYNGKIAWSEDGKNWNPVVNSSYNETIYSVIFNDDYFLASDGYHNTFISSDGIQWQKTTNFPCFFSIAFDDNMFVYSKKMQIKIIYGNGYFVGVGGIGYAGQITWSEDGLNWVDVKHTTFRNLPITAIAYGDGIFVIGGAGGSMAYSKVYQIFSIDS